MLHEFTSWFGDFGSRDGFVSSTHFWDADNGNVQATDIEGTYIGLPYLFTVPNSYQKVLRYLYGSWRLTYKRERLYPYNLLRVDGGRLWINPTQYLILRYSTLVDFYKTGHVMVDGYKDESDRELFYDPPVEVILPQRMVDNITWEIVGRVCHLIQDISVPAHAHRDEHGPTPDIYEPWIQGSPQSERWNGDNSGTFMDPYVSSNPIHYLMYTTQQIADHFGSTGPYEGDGNDDIFGDHLPEDVTFLEALPLSSLGLPTSVNGPWSGYLENIRDNTIPHVIRATAGFLYWFAHEAGLLEPMNITVRRTGIASHPNFFYRENIVDEFLPSGEYPFDNNSFPKQAGDYMSLRSRYELYQDQTTHIYSKFFSWSSFKHPATAEHQNDFIVQYSNGSLDADHKEPVVGSVPTLGFIFEHGSINPPSNSQLFFKNPWYVNPSASTRSLLDQHDEFLAQDVSLQGLATSTHNGGVFLNAGAGPVLKPPYYSLRASKVLDRQSMNHKSTPLSAGDWAFTGWSATNSDLVLDPERFSSAYPNPDEYDTKAVIFKDASANVSANYKAHRYARSATTPTSTNSQRKVAVSADGVHHATYESDGNIYYTKSTDRGNTWSPEQRVSDLNVYTNRPSICERLGVVCIVYTTPSEVVLKVGQSIYWQTFYTASLQTPAKCHPVVGAMSPSYQSPCNELIIFLTWEDDIAFKKVLKFAALDRWRVLYDNEVLVSGQTSGASQFEPLYPSVAAIPDPTISNQDAFHIAWFENGSIYYSSVFFFCASNQIYISGWTLTNGLFGIETVHDKNSGLGRRHPAAAGPSIAVSPAKASIDGQKVIVAFDILSNPFLNIPLRIFLVKERFDNVATTSWMTTGSVVLIKNNVPTYMYSSVGTSGPPYLSTSTRSPKSDFIRVVYNASTNSCNVARFTGNGIELLPLADIGIDPNITGWSDYSTHILSMYSGPATYPFSNSFLSTQNNLYKTSTSAVFNQREIVVGVDTAVSSLSFGSIRLLSEGNQEAFINWDSADDSLLIGINTTVEAKMRTASFAVPQYSSLTFERVTFGINVNQFPALSAFLVQIRSAADSSVLLTNQIAISRSQPTPIRFNIPSIFLHWPVPRYL